MNWKFFANLAVGFLESAGWSKVNEDPNDEGIDDIIGQSLLFAAKVVRWALSGGQGDAPRPPAFFTGN